MWHWYYKVLANRPHLVLISVAVFSIACIVISLTFKKLPEFTDPALVSHDLAFLGFTFNNELS